MGGEGFTTEVDAVGDVLESFGDADLRGEAIVCGDECDGVGVYCFAEPGRGLITMAWCDLYKYV